MLQVHAVVGPATRGPAVSQETCAHVWIEDEAKDIWCAGCGIHYDPVQQQRAAAQAIVGAMMRAAMPPEMVAEAALPSVYPYCTHCRTSDPGGHAADCPWESF